MDNIAETTNRSRGSFASKLRKTLFPGSSRSSGPESRPPGPKMPPRSGPQYSHPLRFGPPSGFHTVCTGCGAENSATFVHPCSDFPYEWRGDHGNDHIFEDVWCDRCSRQNSIPFDTKIRIPRQAHTARESRYGERKSIMTLNQDSEGMEQPPPACNDIEKWTNEGASNGGPHSSSGAGPDGTLNTSGCGLTSRLLSFNGQKGKID